eukprot:NODE_715_length_4836_cov_0.118640.p2 type:complete len:484 gc:universal NODE_715_length_4836_cov_0.118640:1442-2893(+)
MVSGYCAPCYMLEVVPIFILTYIFYDYLIDFCHAIPGPTNWFGVGNSVELSLDLENLLDHVLKYYLKYTTWTIKIVGSPRYVFTNNVRNLQYILNENFDNYIKGARYKKNFKYLMGDGIFSADGERWEMQRAAAEKVFHADNFESYITSSFNRHLQTVCYQLQSAVTLDFYALMHMFTLDAFTEIGFGKSVNSLNQKDNDFATCFDGLQKLADETFSVPKSVYFLKNLFYDRFATRKKYLSVIDKFSYDIIQNRLLMFEIKNDDLLSHFLRLKKDNGESYKPKFLRDIIINFILAGRDTTAQALSWTVYELRNRPEIIEKIRKESAASIKDRSMASYEEIKSLKYTTAVFMECLRLHPSVPKNIKYAVNDDVLPDGTKIKAGWGVGWSPWCQARSPAIWGEDCMELKPERFLDAKYDPNMNFSFHHGPRVCLGQNMAILEAVLTIARIYSNFDIEVLTKDATYNSTVTLQMKAPLMVKATQRK